MTVLERLKARTGDDNEALLSDLLETAKYSFYVEPNQYEVKHLREADETVKVNDLLDRFIDIDEAYRHTPWNLSQIINNIAMVAGVEE